MPAPPLRLVGFALAAGLAAVSAPAPGSPRPGAIYEALRTARPEGPAVEVSGLTLERDVFRLRFDSGAVQFLSPVSGRTVGAVFVGSGAFELAPAPQIEQQHLALVTGERSITALRTPFDRAVLLFTDATEKEIAGGSGAMKDASSRFAQAHAAFERWRREELRINVPLRLLESLLSDGPASRGVFLAWIPGGRYPPGLAAVDPEGLDWLIGRVAGESSAFVTTGDRGGIWYCAADASTARDNRAPVPPPGNARALWYGIETSIFPDARLEGTTTIRLTPTIDRLRVLRLSLAERLRITSAEALDEDGHPDTPLEFLQEAENEDSEPAVLFPEPPACGGAVRLRLTYAGRGVLRNAGDGNFLVGARDNWYPNLGWLHDTSSYELVYRHPKDLEIVSVGTKVSERSEGGETVAVWKTDRPIRVAGFNYGRFREIERADPETGFRVRVYTNRGTPDFIHSLNQKLIRQAAERPIVNPDTANFVSGIHSDAVGIRGSGTLASSGLSLVHVDPDILASVAIADGLATARVGRNAFGDLPETRIAITQQTQALSGQSWPGLLYVPYLAALDPASRREIGLKGSDEFIERVVPHEFAHQWWGQLIGWQGYRDRWLSEGFAEFTAALVIESVGGAGKADDYWERARRRILAAPGAGVSNAAAGPIAMGPRLATPQTPAAYDVLVYQKGAYVLQMLRLEMRDWSSSEPDAAFFAMMRDFVATYRDRNPSTRDFQGVVRRHVAPRMPSLAGEGVDRFFEQWVYGIDVPRLRHAFRISRGKDDAWHATGWVTQDGVPADFQTVAQLFVEGPRGELRHLGSLPLAGNVRASLDFPLSDAARPRRVAVNPHHEVLSRD